MGQRTKGIPKRGPSRDRTLPGKQRIQMRRYLKWLEKAEEQNLCPECGYENDGHTHES